MTRHLGADAAALVDGELGHDARERALAHLAGCRPCRDEVDAERRFKARLRALGSTAVPVAPDLTARLLAVSAAPLPNGAVSPARPGRTGRPPGRPSSGPAGRRPGGRRSVRAAVGGVVGGVVAAAGLGAVLLLDSPARTPARTPVDPASEVLLVDHAGIVGEVALPVGVSSANGP